MKILIGADHKGCQMQDEVIKYLEEKNYDVQKSSINYDKEDDYTDFAFDICEKINEESLGILICGNGIGMAIAANKVKGIRAARILTVEDAFKCKNHNDANVITLSSEVDLDITNEIIETFINTPRATEKRYLRRVTKINDYEGNICEY